MDTPISVFENARSTLPVNVPLQKFLHSRKYITLIEAIRAEADKAARDAMKKKLPGATISGTFTRRCTDGIDQYNGLFCLDFDAADNPSVSPDQMKHILAQFQEVAWAALSVGGKGVYCIIPTNNTNPQQHKPVAAMLADIMQKNGLIADPSCKNVDRLRFVSFDADPYFNPNPRTFDARRLIELQEKAAEIRKPLPLQIRKPPTNDGSKTRERVEQYLDALDGGCRDITDNYDDWIRIGFALASEFGMEGLAYFHRISQWSHKYDKAKTEKKFLDLYRNGRRVKIGSFFKICNDNGIKI